MKNLFLLLFISLTSINVISQEMHQRRGGHCYSIDIPDYMVKVYDLNDAATLEYKNSLKNVYTIVIEDSKDELESVGSIFKNSRDFLDYFIKDFHKNAENRKLSDISEFEANSNECSQIEMTVTLDEDNFCLLITSIESKTHFYKLISWCFLEDKNQYLNDFKKISKSLMDE